MGQDMGNLVESFLFKCPAQENAVYAAGVNYSAKVSILFREVPAPLGHCFNSKFQKVN
jgi:hypothetical protein